MIKTSAEIRQQFLDYFAEREHRIVPSSSLVPANDPTLMFTNAGMVQFKDVFLGADKRPYTRATSSQRCVRAGGKHNDLDQVGYTARHHTFFEMLGNFSFGDYFKREAIEYAWKYLIEVAGLPPEKLWVTVYEQDDEAADIWLKEIGVDPARFSRIGAHDNFWAMGDTGPCGPCTEIFFDHGPHIAGGPPGTPEEDGDRYVEIWNLVFMQFDRNAQGEKLPLPKPCVDTGMGLERLAAVLQGVHSNYDIDLFQALIKSAAELTHCKDLQHNSLKVIADHIRACSFLTVDGVLPSNEGRGYVLRRIIRRAVRHGYKLGQDDLFFSRMVKPLVAEMGQAYPELAQKADFVAKVLRTEEERFAETLGKGMKLLEKAIADSSSRQIAGETVFKLYDTYGFPADLTADVARERGLKIDMAGFDAAMAKQKAMASSASSFSGAGHVDSRVLTELAETEFTGYQENQTDQAEIQAILIDGQPVEQINAGQDAVLVLNRTPFYAESGGQVGDRGEIVHGESRFAVQDTQKIAGTYHGHSGQLTSGQLKVGNRVDASIDTAYRHQVVLNHSGTHLLHAALRKVLGEHVEQKGSLVAADRLRFDFSHFEPVSKQQLLEIETLVNRQIRANAAAEPAVMAYDDALEAGAMALFGEKYGDEVRVMRFGAFSMELCGGTHVERVGDIGLFKLVSETGIASGVRRIEAVTGQDAVDLVAQREQKLDDIAQVMRTSPTDAADKVRQLVDKTKRLEKDLESLRGQAGEQCRRRSIEPGSAGG